MKTLSMTLIVACSVLFGTILSKNEETKIKKSELLISFLQDMKTYMECTLLSTKDIFLKLAENQEYKKLGFVEECCTFLKNGWEFPISYKTSIDDHNFSLTPSCKKIMLSLGEKLGTTDLAGQLSYVTLAVKKIENECELTREKYRKKENMYMPLSVLTGIGIAIMMY